MSTIPVVMLPLPEIAKISGIPEDLLCEFVRRRLVCYRDGPADWGVPPDHPMNDPRRAKLSLEEAVFVHEIHRDCAAHGGSWVDLRSRLDHCGWDGEPKAQQVALEVLQRYSSEGHDRLIERLYAASVECSKQLRPIVE